MNIALDRSLCTGHGRCYVKAPDLFETDDDGYGTPLRTDVPDSLLGQARDAVANCPERAISLSTS